MLFTAKPSIINSVWRRSRFILLFLSFVCFSHRTHHLVSLWITTSHLWWQSPLCLCFTFISTPVSKHFTLLHRHLLLSPRHRQLPSQLNVTGLDWTQLGKKECLKYGGSLVGMTCKFVPDLDLMSFILFFGTYSMTVTLKKFKFSRYFPTKVTNWSVSLSVYFLKCIQHTVYIPTNSF